MIERIKRLLAHAETCDLSVDDPRTTERRRSIVQRNRFLWQVYDEWYRLIGASIPAGEGRVLELGSGAGFLARYVPGLIASEVFACPDIQLVLDARRLPFAPGSLKAIVMVDVLHHVPDTRAFLEEARRCLRPGGVVAMVEPWVSTWSRVIYTHVHHEPFDPDAKEWTFPESGPLSGANSALPWIVFARDRHRFEEEFAELTLQEVRPMMPLRYLLSGGVSMRSLAPAASFPFWRGLDSFLCRWPRHWPMFAFVRLERR